MDERDSSILGSTHSPTRLCLLALCAVVFLALFWSQTIHVPYWQDDYLFLLDARNARLEGRSWLAPFIPHAKVSFWRPLGMETYWRFVETVLGGNVVAAHLTSVLLLVVAAACVGWLVATVVGLLAPGRDRLSSAITAAFLYGVHSSHLLPAAWVAAANDTLCVIFSALSLRFWLVVTTSGTSIRWGSSVLFLLCTLLALLCRDVAFVLPALGLVLTIWLWPRYKVSLPAWIVGITGIGVAICWLMLRNHFTTVADPAYTLRIGANVPRNSVCLLLFLFNTPFEALRYFFFVKPSFYFATWGISCFLLQSAVFWLLFRESSKQVGSKGIAILGTFLVVGLAPYFFLNFNCYPYYTSLALMGYALLAGLTSLTRRKVITVLTLAVLSSFLSTAGNYFLDSPSHIGRARWTEKQLVALSGMHSALPGLFSGQLTVVVEDLHKFLGFRQDGLAYRLGIDLSRIRVVYPNDQEAVMGTVLVVPKEGDVYFRAKQTGK